MHNLDIFGSIFTFTVHQNRQFKTNFGGFLTIICFFICLSMSLFLGKDFFYKLSPKVLQQSIMLENYEKLKIDNNNLTIAWRIEDSTGNGALLDGILNPKIYFYHYEMKKNENKFEFQEIERKRLKLTNCSDFIFGPNHKLKNYINFEEWYCLDFSSMESIIGGYWNTPFLYYFGISLESCDTDPISNTTVCKDPKKIKEFVDKERYISFMFPQAVFSYDDIDNPLQVVYKNFFRSIDMNLLRYDVCDFNRAILADDQGWITKNYVNFTEINFLSCDLTINYQDETDYINNSNVKLISLEFYLKKSINYSHRIFMKIQDLGAIMGGLLNLIILLFQFLNFYVNDFERKKIFVDKLFKYSKETNDDWEKFSHYKKVNLIVHLNEHSDNNGKNKENKTKIKKKNEKDKGKEKENEKENFSQIEKENKMKKVDKKEKEKFDSKSKTIELETKELIIPKNNNKISDLKYHKSIKSKKKEFVNDDVIVDLNYKNNSNTFRSSDLLNETHYKTSKEKIKENGTDLGGSLQDPSFEIVNNDNNYLINASRENQNANRKNEKKKIEVLSNKHSINGSYTEDNLKYKNEINDSNFRRKENENLSYRSEKNILADLMNKKSLHKIDNTIFKGKSRCDKEIKDTIDNINFKKEFDFKKMISKSSNIYKDISFFKNLCFKIFNMNDKNSEKYKKFITFNNGIYILNKNLDLTRYLKNLQMTRMMGKLLLNGNQRHYIKNFYKSTLDRDFNFDFDKKEKRHQHKHDKLFKYITKIGVQNFEGIGKMDKMMIENIFNS